MKPYLRQPAHASVIPESCQVTSTEESLMNPSSAKNCTDCHYFHCPHGSTCTVLMGMTSVTDRDNEVGDDDGDGVSVGGKAESEGKSRKSPSRANSIP